MAILATIALIIFVIEAQIPMPIPIPGVKLGLANAVTLFALFYGVREDKQDRGHRGSDLPCPTNDKGNDTGDLIPCVPRGVPVPSQSPLSLTAMNVFAILLCRIVLGALLTGRPLMVVYSLAGGVLAFFAQVLMKRFVSPKQIWVCGAVGAIFHNIGQIMAAMVLTGTPALIAYLPILTIVGVFTGVLTGLIAQLSLSRIYNTNR